MDCHVHYPDENIYSLIPEDPQHKPKPARHVSMFNNLVKDEQTNNKCQFKTMGQAKVDAPNTNHFLKKGENQPRSPEKTDFQYADCDLKKPSVPTQDEKPVMGLRTTKNFITTNAVENIMSVPKQPKTNYVDTKHGDRQPLDTSGLVPKYVNKRDFGKTPGYLEKRKAEIEHAQDEYNEYIADRFKRGAMRNIQEKERRMILDGLKTNWEGLHHQYQGLSVVTDTAPKKNRKERMEAEMKQLERDIEMIEKHKVIYISHY